MNYDLIVIGSGPAGQKAAISAAKLGKRVAVVERKSSNIGGACLHTGTIPSKAMREAILYLTGFHHRDVYHERYQRKRSITMDDLRRKLSQVTQHELDVIHDHFGNNNIDIIYGDASFASPHEIHVTQEAGELKLYAERILIACGSVPARPDHIPFDGARVFDSDDILQMNHVPRSMVVVGGGVIGIEYAIMFAVMGIKVTVIEGRKRVLDFCDDEIVDALCHHCRSLGMIFRLGEHVTNIRTKNDSVAVELESGKRIIGDTVLFSVGRQGHTDGLGLENAGLQPDKRGRLACSSDFQTDVPSIYAVGDIVGFPALASAAMEQGRRAVCHAFGRSFPTWDQMPYGLFTIPEMSMVGKTEAQLTEECVPYEVGIGRFEETARGQIDGDENGMIKLLFHRETHKILGVHCIGRRATELVHIGQAVMAFDGPIDYFRDAVFNYPTMAECYKVAAFDGLNRVLLDEEFCEDCEEPVTNSVEA